MTTKNYAHAVINHPIAGEIVIDLEVFLEGSRLTIHAKDMDIDYTRKTVDGKTVYVEYYR